jgi:hypothetical protein
MTSACFKSENFCLVGMMAATRSSLMAKTVAEVMNLWPSDGDLAADIGHRIRLVQLWRHRQAIPLDVWPAMLASAQRRGLGLTADILLTATLESRGTRRWKRAV